MAITGSREVDPISRIEGHLGVKLEVNNGFVTGADVHGNLWRGFENFLIGREPNDAITFTQRICGVCPVPHGMTATHAVESVIGYNKNFVTYGDINPATGLAYTDGTGVPAKAVHIRNLVLSAEFLMSHITHFYHLAAPSYVQGPAIPPWTPYFNEDFYNDLLSATGHGATATGTAAGAGDKGALPLDKAGFSKDLWSAVIKQYVKALRVRRLTFEAGALFAGRMPMTSSLVAGGVTQDHTENLETRCDKYEALTKEVGTFIVKEYVPVVLALGALYPAYDNKANCALAASVGLTTPGAPAYNASDPTTYGYGAGCGNFLAWGAFPQPDTNTVAIKGGAVFNKTIPGGGAQYFHTSKLDVDAASALVQDNLVESIAHSRYADYNGEFGTDNMAYPGAVSRTQPKRDDVAKYSWLKAPRWKDASDEYQPMEVGPFARMVVNELYPVDETTAIAAGGLSAYFALYLKGTGLDPAMINADLAVALVREGAAKVLVTAGPLAGLYGATEIAGASQETITAVYTDPNAEIVDTGCAIPAVTWIKNIVGGTSIMDRLRGRALESLFLVINMIGAPSKVGGAVTWPVNGGWIGALRDIADSGSATFNSKATPMTTKSGFGCCEAPRGALAHFVTISGGKISKYQCVVPTTWNASPKSDAAGLVLGPMEKAMVNIPYADLSKNITGVGGASMTCEGGVEALRVAQSFDPCIACAVH